MYADHLLENMPTTLEAALAEVERLRIANGSLKRLAGLVRFDSWSSDPVAAIATIRARLSTFKVVID